MKKSDELKQQRTALVKKQGELLQTRDAENRDFSNEERTKFNDLDEQIRSLDKKIEDAIIEERAIANAAGLIGKDQLKESEEKEKSKILQRYSIHRAIRSQLPNQKLDGVELEMHQEILKRARAAGVTISGIGIPSEVRATAQTVTQDSGEYGAELVGEDRRDIIPLLRPQPVIEKLGATYLRNLEGDVVFPVNEGGITATWEGEIDKVDPSKNKYLSKKMSPKRLASTVEISLQNIMQSSIDLERYTRTEMENVIALKIDEAAIEGSGTSGMPTGILVAAGVNNIQNGTDGGNPTWGKIVDMESEIFVKNANAARMGYLINPRTRGYLKQNKGDSADLTYIMTLANELNGYPVEVSNLVPGDLTKGSGTNLQAAIFGDFSQLIIGEWGWFDMVVDNITRKKEGLVEITINNFLDVLLRHPEAFSKVMDWSLT